MWTQAPHPQSACLSTVLCHLTSLNLQILTGCQLHTWHYSGPWGCSTKSPFPWSFILELICALLGAYCPQPWAGQSRRLGDEGRWGWVQEGIRTDSQPETSLWGRKGQKAP